MNRHIAGSSFDFKFSIITPMDIDLTTSQELLCKISFRLKATRKPQQIPIRFFYISGGINNLNKK